MYIKIQPQRRIGVAIGEHILDIYEVAHLFNGSELKNNQHVLKEVYSTCNHVGLNIVKIAKLCFQSTLNSFMGLGPKAWTEARKTLQDLLSTGNKTLEDDTLLREKYL